jgi:hypothetical protein
LWDVNPIETIGTEIRDMPMTTYNKTIRVGIVDAVLNVIGDEF